jgi:hypothetical protein
MQATGILALSVSLGCSIQAMFAGEESRPKKIDLQNRREIVRELADIAGEEIGWSF